MIIKKKSFRSISAIDNKIYLENESIKILNNDTENIIEYIDRDTNENKKEYKFWELLEKN